MIGKSFSHYKVIKKIGEGGMGQVYLAQDSTLRRQVAIKVLPPNLLDDAERSPVSSAKPRSLPPSITPTLPPCTASRKARATVA